jgi:hypothetical protein
MLLKNFDIISKLVIRSTSLTADIIHIQPVFKHSNLHVDHVLSSQGHINHLPNHFKLD